MKVRDTNRLMPTMQDIADKDMLQMNSTNKRKAVLQSDVMKKLKYFEGTLKPYQEEGLTWMVVRLNSFHVSGI